MLGALHYRELGAVKVLSNLPQATLNLVALDDYYVYFFPPGLLNGRSGFVYPCRVSCRAD
jgi:hypothetical protein